MRCFAPYPQAVIQMETSYDHTQPDTEQGVKQIKAAGLDARYVFIAPPAFEALEARLRGRGTETDESIQKRLAQAKAELEFSKVPGVHDRIIVNNDKERAFKELDDFVFGN